MTRTPPAPTRDHGAAIRRAAGARWPVTTTTGGGRPRTCLTRTAAAATAAVLLAAATAVPPAAATHPFAPAGHQSARACPRPAVTPAAVLRAIANQTRNTAPTQLAYPSPARVPLRELAARLSTSRCDRQPGRFDLIHYRWWSSPTAPGTDELQDVMRWYAPAGPSTMKDLTQWYAPDGSGAQLATQYPPSVVEVTPDHWQALDALDPRLADSFGDTDLLRAAIRSWDRPPDTARVLNGVARLATWRSPRRLDRGMLLTVLAELPGLLYYQRVADRAGRPGIGLAVTSVYGTRRGLLILHPDTGEALAYESAHRSGVGWRVTTYILYLTHSHAPARWWEPPNLPPRAKAPRPRLYPHLKRSWLVPTDEPCHITTPPTRGETR